VQLKYGSIRDTEASKLGVASKHDLVPNTSSLSSLPLYKYHHAQKIDRSNNENMPPLAKTFVVDDKVPGAVHHHHVVSEQEHNNVKQPPLPLPLTTSLSLGGSCTSIAGFSKSHGTSESSNHSSSFTSYNSNNASQPSTASLTAFHAVKSSLRAIVLFLENSGVGTVNIQELIHLIANKLFLEAMARAEEYLEHRLIMAQLGLEDVDALTLLFTAAWTKLVEYNHSTYQKARQEYARYQNAQWQEFIGQQGLQEDDQERRKRRHVLLKWNPTERQHLVSNVNQSIRAKMDAEKGLALNKEWTRYISNTATANRLESTSTKTTVGELDTKVSATSSDRNTNKTNRQSRHQWFLRPVVTNNKNAYKYYQEQTTRQRPVEIASTTRCT
jgi:hypothetical protein